MPDLKPELYFGSSRGTPVENSPDSGSGDVPLDSGSGDVPLDSSSGAPPSPPPVPNLVVPNFSIVGGYTGAALISYYDPAAPLPVTVTGTLVVNVNAAGKLEYDPSLTAPIGAVKSLTLTDPSVGATGKEHLIGRFPPSALNEIKLQLDKNGSLGFRSSPGGSPIGSYAEFQLISSDPVHLMSTYKLEADLDLMNELWEPVGKAGAKFAGTFDGSRKTLSNLKIEKAGEDNVGLFSVVTKEVKNLGILNGTVNGRNNVGGIAGSNEGAIFACYYTGAVTGTGYNAGGIAGSMSGGGTITACYNEAAVNGGYNVGGLAGDISGGTMTACYNTGAVNGNTVGGVAGNLSGGTITACYNAGLVTGTNYKGVVGQGSGASDCYWRNGMGGGSSSGGQFGPANGFNPPSGGNWGTGDGSGPGAYWKPGTVNGQNGVSTTGTTGDPYPLPKLFFEP
ncbi:hypothetical protein AGMMS49546_14530 [Spirochaetia bacterium]|nr:hypothetical protein AGMMS49546_14530 [Spirochaetia bacterium]